MLERIKEFEDKYELLTKKLIEPGAAKDQKEFTKVAKEHKEIEEIINLMRKLQKIELDIQGSKDIIKEESDPEIIELAKADILDLKMKEDRLEKNLRLKLAPGDPNDEKNVILEIRAGTGGEEAAIFAADLFRMYSRYAESKNWKLEILSSHDTGIGGFKEIICSIDGEEVYSRLKYESGGHRVQRVPVTESGGRIHTSAVTVAVLVEMDEVEIEVNPEDLRIDVFRSTGPGGQSVNTTDSAVRITHIPSGIVVQCQDEKSQHKNKAKAMKVLRARLYDRAVQEQAREQAEKRKSLIGSGDRSQRIRTYNYPQTRVTDHRIDLTLYKLQSVLDGELDVLIEPLIEEDQIKRLAESGKKE